MKHLDLIMSDFLEALFSQINDNLFTQGADCDYSDGVFEINFKGKIFVINKNSSSGRIWYSSPVSKPKYYNYHESSNCFIENTLQTNILDDLRHDLAKIGLNVKI